MALVLFAASVSVAGAAPKDGPLKTNEVKASKYSITFPIPPTKTSYDVSRQGYKVALETYAVKDGDFVYMFAYGKTDKPWADLATKKANLDDFFNSISEAAPSLNIRSKKQSETAPYDLTFYYTSESQKLGTLTTLGSIFMQDDSTLVKVNVVYVGSGVDVAKAKYKEFLRTLKLKS